MPFGFPFGFPLGGQPYVPPFAESVDYIPNWLARLQGRLYEQFRELPNIAAVLDGAVAPQVQALEDAFQGLFTLLSIDSSQGVQLDRIGRIVGQDRLGLLDIDYRVFLRGRVLANRSRGTPEDQLAVLRAVAPAGAVLDYTLEPIAGYTISLFIVPITDLQATITAKLLASGNRAGVRMIFRWQESADTAMFRLSATPVGHDGPIDPNHGFADTAETSGGHLAGAVAP